MEAPRVRVFFYGSFINRDVLARGGLIADRFEVARAWGFDIHIKTLATLVRSDQHCVYGVVVTATHTELDRLYLQDWLGHAYLPEAVLVETQAGYVLPTLCYIAHASPPGRPAGDYLDWILNAARDLGFPAWYIERLERAGTR
jgi:hypothetical protein